MITPAGIAWNDQAAAFIDRLVDRDIAYLDAQIAVEALIQAGLHDEVTATFDLDDQTVHWHCMPALLPGLKPLDIFTTIDQHGLISVVYMRFADGTHA